MNARLAQNSRQKGTGFGYRLFGFISFLASLAAAIIAWAGIMNENFGLWTLTTAGLSVGLFAFSRWSFLSGRRKPKKEDT